MIARAALLIAVCACAGAAAQEQPTVVFGTTVVIPAGLRGLVYHIHHNTKKLPNFAKMRPAGAAIYTSSLNVPPQNFKAGFPGVTKRFDWFAIDYTGRFWIAKPGRYTFSLMSDDGAKLYIDDRTVIDNDGQHPPQEMTGMIDLTGGVHRIRVSYFQGPRFAIALVLKVAGPGESMRIFSTDEFKPPPEWTMGTKTAAPSEK